MSNTENKSVSFCVICEKKIKSSQVPRRPMDFTGKVMKGFVFVDAGVLTTKKKLEYWIKLALEYNKIAKASKKSARRKPAKKKK